MMTQRSPQLLVTALVFLGILGGTTWTASVSSGEISDGGQEHRIPEAKVGFTEGTLTSRMDIGENVSRALAGQTGSDGPPALGDGALKVLPPGPRTGQYYLPSGYFAVGTHDLGVFIAGQTVTLEVESTTSGMDLIAVIDEPDVTVNRGRFFADDESGGDHDPALRFVAPVTGNYTLRIRDLNQRSGFYRYRVSTF